MAFFPVDDSGKYEDRAHLRLADTLVLSLQSYEISQRFLTVPSAFAARIGDGDSAIELITSYPPKTPYALYVGDPQRTAAVPQHTGELDGSQADGGSEGTVVNLTGRDTLAQLHDSYATADKSFGDITYAALVEACLDAAGITDYLLIPSNEANRRVQGGLSSSAQVAAPRKPEGVRTGVSVISAPGTENSAQVAEARKQALAAQARTGQSITIVLDGKTTIAEQIAAQTAAFNKSNSAAKAAAKKLQIKLGEKWYDWLKKELDRAGLFLWAGVDANTYILSEPNAKQKPTYRIFRKRGMDRNEVNVLSHRFKNTTEQRHSKYIVVGRGGSGKGGREKVRGEFIDQEMIDLGYVKEWAHEDQDAKSVAQCEYYARRACAEARCAGWELTYVIEGHTLPSLLGNGRAVLAVDTVIEVQDDELGIYGPHWIEGVTLRGSNSGTTTEITLMRPEDLVFGEGQFLAPKVKKKGGRRRGQTFLRGTSEDES